MDINESHDLQLESGKHGSRTGFLLSTSSPLLPSESTYNSRGTMEPLRRTNVYDWQVTAQDEYDVYDGGRQQQEEEDFAYGGRQNVLSSMRATSGLYANVDAVNGGENNSMDGYLMGEEEEDRTHPFLSALMQPLRKLFSDEAGDLNFKGIGQAGLALLGAAVCYFAFQQASTNVDIRRPDFVNHHPYVSSSYYASTQSLKTLLDTERLQVRRLGGKAALNDHHFKARVAVVRPFCEFDAEALPSTFAVWNQLPPCRASATDLDLGTRVERNSSHPTDKYFDDVGTEIMQDIAADVFLFYSQTFSENEVAIKAVDTIIDQFNEPGGWSQCFANIYAIEANIPQELDLYIPSAQEELYNWVNGPNRQFEAAFRIIQSGEWGDYDGFYLMEGDSIPIKNNWLDVVLSEIESNRPFAVLGA
jgi:hypothetical protein